jgi:NADPH:quinone reductase-like Zn-dependent oxidoreductase
MKAIGGTEFGGPEVLRVLDLPVPQAGPGEIRIRVQPPYVPGMEVAGVVEQPDDGENRA